jgi:glycosyltransferase involved in cell wall biosynthesis
MTSRRPRIGVDFHVVDGKYQGSRTHVVELFRRVIAGLPEADFFLFLDSPAGLAALGEEFGHKNVVAVKMPLSNPAVRLALQLPGLQARHRLDLLHVQYVAPLPSRSRFVVTIHDVLFESMPEHFSAFFRLRSSVLMRSAAARAEHVFTVSEYSRSEIAVRFGTPVEKITVIPNAVSSERFRPGPAGENLVQARGLSPRGYLLTVGRLEPRKNQATLVRAYARLRPPRPTLVLAGQRDFGYGELFRSIRTLGLEREVIVVEDASDAELAALYRHAAVFVYPSFGEGFGLPPLEAMASGTPVITSTAPALTEVTGDAAITAPANDADALAGAITRVLGEPGLAAALVEKGLARVRCHSWADSAARVVDRYREILALRSVSAAHNEGDVAC